MALCIFHLCLFMTCMMLGSTGALEYGYFDLCNQNLRALDQYSKAHDAIQLDAIYISLCHNDLESVDRNFFYKFKKLERINMSDNKRFQFPAFGSSALASSNLIELVCEKCGIVKIFNQSLRELPRLEYLDLGSNSISEIEKYAFQKNRHLRILILSTNLLRWIPSTLLIRLPDIEILDLSLNRELAPVENKPFLRSNALKILKCNNCGFTSIDENTFVKLTNLKELHLRDNTIFQVQETESLPRLDFLTILSTNEPRSTDLQSNEDELEINLEFGT